jgi:hypothetical protein
MATKEMILDLQNHLQSNPQIKTVFFNKAGDWTFHKPREKGGFLTGVSASEVMEDDFMPAGVAKEAPVVTVQLKKLAVDVITAINAAETIESAEAAAAGDKRKSVIDALATKITELSAGLTE